MTRPRIVHGKTLAEYYFRERCHIIEYWNSADDDDASIARARVEPGVSTRLHRLRDTTERYLILAGRGSVEIGGQPAASVAAGDVVVIPPGTSQRITNSGDADLVFLAICTPRFTPAAYEDIDPEASEPDDGDPTP